jgi:hypothetical protein
MVTNRGSFVGVRPIGGYQLIAESADASDRVLLVLGSVFFGGLRCECRDRSRIAAAQCGRHSDPSQHRAVLSSEVQTADDSR